MKYTTMANTIQSILEGRSLVPIINTKVEEPLETDEPEDDADVGDTTVNYPPKNHDRLDDTVPNDMERMKSHLKHSMRRQNKLKIIDNT